MIPSGENAGDIDHHRFVFPRWEADGAPRYPPGPRVLHLEHGRLGAQFVLLRQRDVDARIGRINPAAQEQQRSRTARVRVEIEDQLVRLRQPLVAERRQVRDVAIVVLAQIIQNVVAASIDR